MKLNFYFLSNHNVIITIMIKVIVTVNNNNINNNTVVMMWVIAPLLLCLISALVEVHSQTAPNVTLMGINIPNNSYVNLTTVGTDFLVNDIQCYTDLVTCCSGAQGPNRGDWYFPNTSRLRFDFSNDIVYESRHVQVVRLLYTGSNGTSGIYRCDIETIAVNNSNGRETLYIGLYTSGGE